MNFGMDFQGGGGYTTNNNSFGGGGGTQDTNNSDKKGGRRSYDEQTLIPVTIQMANNAHIDHSNGDGSLVLEDGRPVHTIKLFGAVRSVDDMSTNVMYQIEDGTGIMEVKQWLDDNDSSAVMEMRKETMKENIYIKIVGQIKDYEGRKLVVANSVRPLSTGNELTHHLLEVMYSAEKFKRADSIVPPMMMQPNNLFGGNTMGGGMTMGGTGGGDGNAIKDRVFHLMQQRDNDSEEGVSIDTCIQLLPDIPEAEVRRAVELLSEEGQVYSTINENQYKVAT